MKVSLEIQNKMHKLAKYVEQSKVLTEEIDHFFDAKGFAVEELRHDKDNSLNKLNAGIDITDKFVNIIQSRQNRVRPLKSLYSS